MHATAREDAAQRAAVLGTHGHVGVGVGVSVSMTVGISVVVSVAERVVTGDTVCSHGVVGCCLGGREGCTGDGHGHGVVSSRTRTRTHHVQRGMVGAEEALQTVACVMDAVVSRLGLLAWIICKKGTNVNGRGTNLRHLFLFPVPVGAVDDQRG